MLRAIVNIFKGLVNFFRLTITIVKYIPSAFKAIWGFFASVTSLLGTFPAGIAALGALSIALAIIYLVIGR